MCNATLVNMYKCLFNTPGFLTFLPISTLPSHINRPPPLTPSLPTQGQNYAMARQQENMYPVVFLKKNLGTSKCSFGSIVIGGQMLAFWLPTKYFLGNIFRLFGTIARFGTTIRRKNERRQGVRKFRDEVS